MVSLYITNSMPCTINSFHPLSVSRSAFTPSSSMSTTYESPTPIRPSNAMDEDPPAYGYSVTIFGFRPDQRQHAINAFMTEQARVKEDEQESEEAKSHRNWVEIEYVNQWEAMRAVRKSGIMSLEGGNVKLGAVWTDPSQAPMEGYANNGSMNPPGIDMQGQSQSHGRQGSGTGLSSPLLPNSNPGLSGGGATRSVRVRPSASAFRSATVATSNPIQQQQTVIDEFGIAAEAKRLEAQGQNQQSQPQVQDGVLNRVSSMVFGSWAR
ncbi:hypothetical protein FRB94_007313 [Tulasnella sp. JGI-2019a]|nr:hypothetical protein FRB94_007313 [Tulasnella sp. JGI-2019a]